MKKIIIYSTMAIIILLAAMLITGCKQQYPPAAEQQTQDTPKTENATDGPEVIKEIATFVNETNLSEVPADIVEKRGQMTNITDFNTLILRASNIQTYKYNITDTGISNEEYQFWVRGRFIKIWLPEQKTHKTGEKYDEILLDRVTKTAFSHCGKRYCVKPNLDKELEKVNYTDYYINDPMEYLYKASFNPTYLGPEQLGEQYTKVFKTTFEGNPAKVWLQEYYGFPLKIEVNLDDGTLRKIIFKNLMVDATRSGETDTPFNFTVKGEGNKTWYFWEHYLGDWPNKGTKIGMPAEPVFAN